jgi:U4/U6.U5 tri-snRNP-associated protein 1
MVDLSIDEANKIRLSMGLPALPGGSASAAPTAPVFKAPRADDSDEEPASTIDIRQAAASDNWLKLEEERKAKEKRAERAAAIKKARERASLSAKLEGKGLAEEADGVDDDMAWLKNSKKRQKKIAKEEQMRKELEERERQALEAMQYTDKDLAGVKVGHEVDQFDDEDQILVLKDTAVDADEDDELEAVELREKERLQERLDSKKRKRAYDPNDMDESGQKSLLAQYDEDINGKKGKAFTLDGKGRTVETLQAQAADASRSKKVAISLDILNDAPANDYMDYSEVKMKKPKKKKSKKSKRERIEDEEDMVVEPVEEPAADIMDLDGEVTAPQQKKKKVFDESFVDDDDLQANLADQRQKALKKRKKMRPEDLARQLREEASTPQPDVMESTEDGDGGLVIDETTEFVQNLGAVGDADEETARRKRRKSSHISEGTKSMGDIPAADEDGDVDMNQSYAEAAEAEEARNRSISRARSTDITDTGLEAEKTVDQGVGATLALLRSHKELALSNDSSERAGADRARQKFLVEKAKAEAESENQRKLFRERERNSARWAHLTPREREEMARKNNASADMQESRRLADLFNKEYKPTVDIRHVDEHGRTMNQKEAFKQLSHQFHGKGSGNTKTKKHLDKIANEKKKMAESSLEAGRSGRGGLGNAFDDQAKKKGTAGVRLQ